VKLSVVIPAYNEEKLLGVTLEHLRAALAPCETRGYAAEQVVVDNASGDRTAAIAAAHGARVVFEPVRQIARARNAGAAQARGEWLLFLDADSWPDAALVEAMLRCLESGRVVGGGSTIRVNGVPASLVWMAPLWNGLSRALRWAAGSFLFCRADAFHAVGGFDLSFYVAEEIDLSRRLKRWGAARGQGFVVLHRSPLLTSERKASLYSGRELRRSLWRFARHPRRFVRDPSLCHLWYDGRR